MTKDMPFVGVTLSPQVKPNIDWYARTILKSGALTPTSTAPTSLAYNITPRTYSFKTHRGRTYDLGRLEAGHCDLKVDNSDGLFDPTNFGSPLYPNVQPYRPARITAAYPRTGNILNDTNKGYAAQRTIQLISAVGNGTSTFYTAVSNVPFHRGQYVSITGMGGANTSSAQITTALNSGGLTTGFTLPVAFSGTLYASGYASAILPATLSDNAVSVCANDSNFELGTISNWYTMPTSSNINASNIYAHSGTYSMRFGGTTYNIYLDVPCVAGQTVTFSAWVRTNTGSFSGYLGVYAGGYINSTISPTTTSFTANTTWTRYSVTVVATAPKITLQINNSTVNYLYVDDVQVEFGSTATTNTTTGSTIYNLFNGFVERYPQTYQAPNRGEVNMIATDVVSMMSQNIMVDPYFSLMIQDPAVYYYFPLDEPSVTAPTITKAVSNGSSVVYTALNDFEVGQVVNVQGLTTATFNGVGTITAVTNQTFTTALAITAATLTNQKGSAISNIAYNKSQYAYNDFAYAQLSATGGSAALGSDASKSLLGFNGATCAAFTGSSSTVGYFYFPTNSASQLGMNFAGWVVDAWVNFSTAGTFMRLTTVGGTIDVKVTVNTLSATYTPTTGSPITATLNGTTYPFSLNTWELVRVSGDNTKLQIELVGKGSASAATTAALYPQIVRIGSLGNSGFVGFAKGLRVADLNTLINTPEDLFLLGAIGNYNDSTGVRVQSLMGTYSGFNYFPVATDMGAFTMQQINIAGKSLFDAVQTASESEFGYWFIDGAGVINFKDGYTRNYPNTTVKTFGDGVGEIPYQGGDVVINYDLTYVYNQVDIKRLNGGSFNVQDNTSVNEYFPRSLSLQVENATDAQLSSASPFGTDIATSYLNRYSQPILRSDHLVLTPFRNPAIWADVLGLEVGDYIKIIKRPIGGNPIIVYGWIENIEHNFDGQTSDWITTVVFSPAPAPS